MQASVEVHQALPKIIFSPPRSTDDATICCAISLLGNSVVISSHETYGACSWSWHLAGRESLHKERTTYAGQRDSCSHMHTLFATPSSSITADTHLMSFIASRSLPACLAMVSAEWSVLCSGNSNN